MSGASLPQAPGADDFQQSRGERIGTHLAGTEGLKAPAQEGTKLRLVPGKVVPGTRYRVLRWLGEGGMGVVYEAEHVDIERHVAMKILRFDLSLEPRMAQVFRDEARAASRMGSPNIVEIYDFGELPDGRLFFCMELLDGKDLVLASESEPMDAPELIGVLRQVCRGLHQAHQAGVVHRDIKPENIIRVNRGRPGTVKIVDFGISSMLAAGSGSDGTIAGTPHYMAPEQITGQPFDARLDIYAVGVMAYELLVGRPPFDAPTLEALLQRHLDELPTPPSRVRTDGGVPPALERVIVRCLEKAPDARYRDMAELEAAICEAQIEAGLQTAWDDLPLPELDDLERRERLLRQMPSPLALELKSPRRFLWPAIAAGSVLASLGLAAVLVFGRGATAEQRDVVEALTTDARGAAARFNWVYPPPDEPQAPTSFAKVVALEHLEGAADPLGDARARELRTEFATTLVAFGDKLWAQGAQRPAREFYAMALLFDGSLAQPLERSGLTPIELADLRKRAEEGRFLEGELIISRALGAAVTDDASEREQYLAQVEGALADADVSRASLEFLDEAVPGSAAKRGRRGAAAVDTADAAGDTDAPPTADSGDGDAVAAVTAGDAEATAGDADATAGDDGALPSDAAAGTNPTVAGGADAPKASSKRRKSSISGDDAAAVLDKAERDPTRADELAEQGLAALRAGRRGEAEALFNQAIAFDRTSAKALMGLSDVYFDTGADTKAVLYAERAVKASSRTAAYRLKLGDAYYKVLRYNDALTQYEEAAKLGSDKAAARIAKVKAKLGG